MAGALDIFVPTCEYDLDQAAILFRSMSRFMSDDVVATVTVAAVDNADAFDTIRTLPTAAFQDVTRYVRLCDLGIPDPQLDGWVLQQAAKLEFAKQATTEFYVVLDSKNIARRPIELADFVRDGAGAAHHQLATDKPSVWRDAAWALDHRRFDRSRGRHVLSVFTPVVFHTQTVVEMVDYLERKFEQPVTDFLRAQCTMTATRLGRVLIRAGVKRAVTEFPLYYVYLDKIGQLDRLFWSPRLLQQPDKWWALTDDQRSALLQSTLDDDGDGLFGGIHRIAWRHLSEDERSRVREFVGMERRAS